MNVEINKLLGTVRSGLMEAEKVGGSLAADNESDVWEAMEGLMNEVLDALVADYDNSEDEFLDLIFMVADDLAAEGKLPAFPEDDASDEAVAEWLGKARTVGFTKCVLKAAQEQAE